MHTPAQQCLRDLADCSGFFKLMKKDQSALSIWRQLVQRSPTIGPFHLRYLLEQLVSCGACPPLCAKVESALHVLSEETCMAQIQSECQEKNALQVVAAGVDETTRTPRLILQCEALTSEQDVLRDVAPRLRDDGLHVLCQCDSSDRRLIAFTMAFEDVFKMPSFICWHRFLNSNPINSWVLHIFRVNYRQATVCHLLGIELCPEDEESRMKRRELLMPVSQESKVLVDQLDRCDLEMRVLRDMFFFFPP